MVCSMPADRAPAATVGVMGWSPAAVLVLVLVVVGVALLAVVASRVVGALRRTRAASDLLNTSVTGRTRRIQAGVGEAREWRAAHRGSAPAGAEPGSDPGLTRESPVGSVAGRPPAA